jgi:hypothetical protein
MSGSGSGSGSDLSAMEAQTLGMAGPWSAPVQAAATAQARFRGFGMWVDLPRVKNPATVSDCLVGEAAIPRKAISRKAMGSL